MNKNLWEAASRKKRIRIEDVTVLEDEGTEESELPLLKNKRSGNTSEQPQQEAEIAASNP